MIGVHELRRLMQVWRTTSAPDGSGGWTTVRAQVGQVRVMIAQPSAAEQSSAGQSGARLDAVVYAQPFADIRRGDELRDATEVFRVTATISPSEPVYLRADCERIQSEEP